MRPAPRPSSRRAAALFLGAAALVVVAPHLRQVALAQEGGGGEEDEQPGKGEQPKPRPGEQPKGEGEEGPDPRREELSLPIDDELGSVLKRIDDLAARGQWDRVVEQLDRLLVEGGASLVPGEKLESARSVARRKLDALPAEGRAAYEVIHDDPARRLLEDGARGRDDALHELLRLHPASRSAPRARALLATRLLEAGRPGEALEHLDLLLAAPGLAAEGRERLEITRAEALAHLGRGGEARLALEKLGGAAVEAARARAAAIAARPAAPGPDRPASVAWTSETLGYYEPAPPWAWSLPVADAGRVYLHDGSHAVAIDLDGGRLAWRSALRPEDAFTPPPGPCRTVLAGDVVVAVLPREKPAPAPTDEEVGGGGRGIPGLLLPPGLPGPGGPPVPGAPPKLDLAPRRAGPGGLVALDRATGDVRWRLPLAAVKAAADIDFPASIAGVAACGPVVVVALAVEHPRPEVHVVAFHAATGETAWFAFLASRDDGPPADVSVAASDGRIAVSTGLGAVVLLDPSGEVRWVRTYASRRDPKNRPRQGGGLANIPRLGPPPPPPPERDAGLLAARGLIWATPPDSVELLAWDLESGEVLASQKQPEVGRIVGAHGSELLVLSKDGDLFRANRSTATLVAQLGGGLVGEPAACGDRVYLPRVDGLIAVDLKARTSARVMTWERAKHPGNLLVAGEHLLIAAPRGLLATGAGPAPPRALILSEYARALGDQAWATREEAQRQLRAQGAAARPALEPLLASRDLEQRTRAQVLLAELDRVERVARWAPLVKPAWAEAVPDALNRLTHMNAEVRLEALRALGGIGDPDVVALLKDLLADREERVGWAAAVALMSKKDRAGAEHLARCMKRGLPQDQLVAAITIGQHGSAVDLDALAPGLASEDDEVRAATVFATLKLGGQAALPRVRALARDPASEVRLQVIAGLSEAGDEECLRLLADLLDDEDDLVRLTIVSHLREHTTSPEAMRGLGRALGDTNLEVAKSAAEGLHKGVQNLREVVARSVPVDALERASESEDARVRLHASQIAVWTAGNGGLLTVRTLANLISDPNIKVHSRTLSDTGRGWTKGWLHFLRERVDQGVGAADIAALATMTLHEEPRVRVKGYEVLARIAAAPGAARVLVTAFDDSNEKIRQFAVEDTNKPAVRDAVLGDPVAVEEVLKIEALSSRAEGKLLAGRFLDQAPRPRLVPGLLRALRVAGPGVQAAAAKRLAVISQGKAGVDPAATPPPEPAVMARAFAAWWWREEHPGQDPGALVALLRDNNPSERWRAAEALAGLPTPAVRNALAAGIAQEPLEWVLRARVKALVNVLGEAQGYREGCSEADLRACAQRLALRVAQVIQSENAPGGPR